MGKGTVNCSLISIREILIRMLLAGAVSFILCHNHPSGDTNPSQEDIQITESIGKAGSLIGVSLLDHLIIGEKKIIPVCGKYKQLRLSKNENLIFRQKNG